jgi:Uma2 family endonuclease
MLESNVLVRPPLSVARRRFTSREYYAMLEAGILHEDDRLELIEGEIIEMSPINPAHASHVARLMRLFAKRLDERAFLSPQNPLDLGDLSQPEPDVLVLKPREDDYERSHPAPADVLLLVEVSDSTIDYDRNVKALLYARVGVREMWIVNLPERQLEIYRHPTRKGYNDHHTFKRGEAVALLAFPEATFQVSEILSKTGR